MPDPRGTTRLRRLNAVRVLDALRRSATPATVTELVAGTGLSRASVESLVSELETGAVVQATTAPAEGRGRPARRYRIRSTAVLVAGIDIGAHRTRVEVADLTGTVVGDAEQPTTPELSADQRLDGAVATVRAALADVGHDGAERRAPIVPRLHVGTAGIVDRTGTVRRSGAIQHWDEAPIGEALTAAFPTAVVDVDNDIRLAALAEQRGDQTSSAEDVVHVHLGSRTAAAIIIGGHPHRGRDGAAAEVGYLPAPTIVPVEDPAGPPHDAIAATLAAADQGGAVAVDAVDRYLDQVCDRIVLLTDAVAPEAVVLGGGLAGHRQLILDPLMVRLRARLDPAITVTAAIHGTNAVARGAVIAALDGLDSASVLDRITVDQS